MLFFFFSLPQTEYLKEVTDFFGERKSKLHSDLSSGKKKKYLSVIGVSIITITASLCVLMQKIKRRNLRSRSKTNFKLESFNALSPFLKIQFSPKVHN